MYDVSLVTVQTRGGRKGRSGSSQSSSVMSSRSATPAASHDAPTYIVISSDDSSGSQMTNKKDPEFTLEQPMKKEGEATLSNGVLVGGGGGGPQVPKPPPVSSEFHFRSQVPVFQSFCFYIVLHTVLHIEYFSICIHVEKKLHYFALVTKRNQNIMSPKRMLSMAVEY